MPGRTLSFLERFMASVRGVEYFSIKRLPVHITTLLRAMGEITWSKTLAWYLSLSLLRWEKSGKCLRRIVVRICPRVPAIFVASREKESKDSSKFSSKTIRLIPLQFCGFT